MLSFFKKKALLYNFKDIGTDMHSHILPGIDDGAKNIEESIILVEKFKSLGYRKLIATPHIMGDYYRNSPKTIHKALDLVKDELSRRNINIEVAAAAEYYLDEFFEQNLQQNNVLTFSNYLLFELSYVNEPNNLEETIQKIRDKGYAPILAHPERYGYFHQSTERYEEIKSWGCYLQLNTISLTGYYGKGVQKAASKLVSMGIIDFMGSDAHHLKHIQTLEESLSLKSTEELLKSVTLNSTL
ncbi:CpsB/CapC family capsule biosynthesis tyrosine phosphatase [Pseudopedobacter sp.]|uniref:tyrosine-protein phosphatase n=1 Tax=Pseudopedobacter sp. TaxID=1936787 RepID=UPI003342BB0C